MVLYHYLNIKSNIIDKREFTVKIYSVIILDKRNIKIKDLAYIGVSSAIIAVCAWITIPFGAVPFTLQTLAVCLVAGLFGAKTGMASVAVYILIGAIGVPVFSGFKGGIGVIAGATGGYIIGFIFTALITGIISNRTKKPFLVFGEMLLGIAACYIFGTVWFMLVYTKEAMPLSKTLALCVTPFIIPDIIKAAAAAFLVYRLRDKILKQNS